MARVPFICLSVILVCTLLLQHAECDENYEHRSPKKHRGQKEQLPSNLFASDNNLNTEGKLEEETQWRRNIEAKKGRHRKLLEEKELRRKHQHRQGRAVTSQTFEIRVPTVTETPDPPPHDKFAEVARFIVHKSGWATVGYTNHHPGKEGIPMATLYSTSDGFANASTGTPYVYITPKDISVQDLAKDNRCSFLMSLAETDYCERKEFDPEDPRCAYVLLTGKLKQLKNGTAEWDYASKIYFDRHPGMRPVPVGHKFRFAKLKISDISLQDYFGGLKFPSVKDYYAVKLNGTDEPILSGR